MSSYDETLRITTEILGRHLATERAIKPSDQIQHDLGLDSLGVMEVVADVEDEFKASIPTDALERIVTVEDVARTLESLRVS